MSRRPARPTALVTTRVCPRASDQVRIECLNSLTRQPDQPALCRPCPLGIFIFSPDDKVDMRGTVTPRARDNVVFEIGLFVSRLTLKRVFLVRPAGAVIALPSDWAGITAASYDLEKASANLWSEALDRAGAQDHLV